MYRHERSTTPDRSQSSHIAAKTAEKTVAARISNQYALSRNITQMQSFDSAPDELHNKLTNRISSRRNNGLPAQLQNGIENLSGYSMDNVRVHYNSPRPARLQALAYAKGEDIFVAPGQEKHLPHEAWHIVQQKQGRAAPTGRVNGADINDNPALEHEADIMGAKAVQLKSAERSNDLRLQKVLNQAAQLQPKADQNDVYKYAFNEIAKMIRNACLMDDNLAMGDDERDDIWENIKEVFLTEENINMIISKVFKSAEYLNDTDNFMDAKYTLTDMYNDGEDGKFQLMMLLEDIKVPIVETLNDIFYWNCTRKREQPKSIPEKIMTFIAGRTVYKDIRRIKLTGSDMHVNGIGVCAILFDDGEKLMIKSGQRNFEKKVYGKEGSLADYFNNTVKPAEILKDEGANVGKLKIEISDKHGSAFEFFPHKQLPKPMSAEDVEKIRASLVMTTIFSSLLGLADLHFENLVYGVDAKTQNLDGRVQIVDGEVGGVYSLDEVKKEKENKKNISPLSTAMRNADMLGSFPSVPKNFNFDFTTLHKPGYINLFINFLNKAKSELKNTRSRIVVIKTAQLVEWRGLVYNEKKVKREDDKFSFYKYKEELIEYITKHNQNGGEGELLDKVYYAYVAMMNDFRKGKIPYYELDFKKGDIYQKTSYGEFLIISDPKKSLDSLISKNTDVLNDIF